MKKIKIVLMLASSMFVFSCSSNTYEEIATVANPTYTANIQKVMAANCVSCHSAGGQGEWPNLETYAEVVDASQNGNLLCRIDASCGRVMPQAGLMPQVTIDMIKTWAAQGYVN